MKKIVSVWKTLGKSIYVGDRLTSNLKALTIISIVSAALGFILIIVNYSSGRTMLMIASIATCVIAACCSITAGVFKNRRIAICFPVGFCFIVFTIYAFTGAGQGMALIWALLLPIGLSYFVSVRSGIVQSTYYSVLFCILFYSPVKEQMRRLYSDQFMGRFPLLFIFVALFSLIAMIQYHRTALFEIEHTNKLNEEVENQTRVAKERAIRLEHITEEIVQTLAHVIDAKDKYTNGHSFRVSEYAVALAQAAGWPKEKIDELRWQALLHDIGKIGVPDAILNKPGKLSEEEFSIIKSHTVIGGDILAESGELLEASNTARYHHERYDGNGYPDGIAGDQIPVNARVVAIADSYDAMHSDRIYRKRLSDEVIRNELEKGRGTQFDPVFLDLFLRLFENGDLE